MIRLLNTAGPNKSLLLNMGVASIRISVCVSVALLQLLYF